MLLVGPPGFTSKPGDGGHDASGEASLRSNAQLLLATPQPTLNLRNLKQLEDCNLSEYNSNQLEDEYLNIAARGRRGKPTQQSILIKHLFFKLCSRIFCPRRDSNPGHEKGFEPNAPDFDN